MQSSFHLDDDTSIGVRTFIDGTGDPNPVCVLDFYETKDTNANILAPLVMFVHDTAECDLIIEAARRARRTLARHEQEYAALNAAARA